MDFGVKPRDADILRCAEPNNLSEFRVDKNNFDRVMKVCKNLNENICTIYRKLTKLYPKINLYFSR